MLLQSQIFNKFVVLNDVSIPNDLSRMSVDDEHESNNPIDLYAITEDADKIELQILDAKWKRKGKKLQSIGNPLN